MKKTKAIIVCTTCDGVGKINIEIPIPPIELGHSVYQLQQEGFSLREASRKIFPDRSGSPQLAKYYLDIYLKSKNG